MAAGSLHNMGKAVHQYWNLPKKGHIALELSVFLFVACTWLLLVANTRWAT